MGGRKIFEGSFNKQTVDVVIRYNYCGCSYMLWYLMIITQCPWKTCHKLGTMLCLLGFSTSRKSYKFHNIKIVQIPQYKFVQMKSRPLRIFSTSDKCSAYFLSLGHNFAWMITKTGKRSVLWCSCSQLYQLKLISKVKAYIAFSPGRCIQAKAKHSAGLSL